MTGYFGGDSTKIPVSTRNCDNCHFSKSYEGEIVCSHDEAQFYCSVARWKKNGNACPVGFFAVVCASKGFWSLKRPVI